MNEGLLLALYNFATATPLREEFVVFFAELLPHIILFVAAPILALRHLRRLNYQELLTVGFVFLAPALIAQSIAQAIKLLYSSARPFAEFSLIPLASVADPMGSFPSSHATLFAALATTFYLHDKKIGLIFAIAALLIGIARIAAGVHWPTDILAGYLLGSIFAYLCDHGFRKIVPTFKG